MRSITAVTFVEMYNIAPIPTVAVTRARRPSLSSLVKLSPTILASLPNLEIMSPVERTPVFLTGISSEVAAEVEDFSVGRSGRGSFGFTDLTCFVEAPCRSCHPMSCKKGMISSITKMKRKNISLTCLKTLV
jgi:hypothetical protein